MESRKVRSFCSTNQISALSLPYATECSSKWIPLCRRTVRFVITVRYSAPKNGFHCVDKQSGGVTICNLCGRAPTTVGLFSEVSFSIFDTQPTAKVTLGWNTSHQITDKTMIHVSVYTNALSRFVNRELRTQKLRSHLLRTQSSKVLPLKPGVGQYIAMHATSTAKDFFPAYFYPSGQFTCIFSKTSPYFSFVGCA